MVNCEVDPENGTRGLTGSRCLWGGSYPTASILGGLTAAPADVPRRVLQFGGDRGRRCSISVRLSARRRTRASGRKSWNGPPPDSLTDRRVLIDVRTQAESPISGRR